MNKYQITSDRSDNVGRLDSNSHSISFNSRVENDNGISNSAEKRKRAFFSHYKKHSRQLVDALKQWSGQLHFIDCEYSDGELSRYNETFIEPYVPFMSYMREHLGSGAYGENFIDPNSIQSKRKAICDKIDDIMVRDSGYLPQSPSFNMLITNRIKARCPLLVATIDADTDSNNFYLHKWICSILFDVISSKPKRTLSLSTTIYEDNIYQLVFENDRTIARGDASNMQTLKTVLESLVEDDYLCGCVKRYHEKRAELTPNIDYIELKRRVEQLHTYIHGGKLLGGFKSCDLCISDVIADIE